MAELSDQLLVVSILAYVAAMVGYAAEYAFGRSGAVSRVAAREPVPMGAAAAEAGDDGGTVLDQPGPPQSSSGPDGRAGAAWAGRAAVAATAVGAIVQIGCLITRALAAGRVPWGNMYEFILVVTLVGVGGWLALLARRPVVRPLGLYVALGAVVLLGLAGMRVYTAAGPLVPALNSAWLKIHVSASAVASGVFLLGFTVAALYLIRRRADAKPSTGLASTPQRQADDNGMVGGRRLDRHDVQPVRRQPDHLRPALLRRHLVISSTRSRCVRTGREGRAARPW